MGEIVETEDIEMESRAAYGYYGAGNGCTGENQPAKPRKKGWELKPFFFEVRGRGIRYVEVRACDYAHAMRQLKIWAKRDGFEIVGDKKGYENQSEY